MNNQKTIIKLIHFSGTGLHTGLMANVTLKPAPANFGIQFCRTDLDPTLFVPARSENVYNTNRSTSIKKYDVEDYLRRFYCSPLHRQRLTRAAPWI